MTQWTGSAPAGRTAYVNGRYVPHGQAGVHIEDRGLQFGDSIYEVCGLFDGRLTDEEPHLDRLERSLGETRMTMPLSRTALKLVMRELVRRNGVRDGLLYLQVTRGAFRRDHPIPKTKSRPTLVMTVRAMDPAVTRAKREHGIAVITQADERWARCDIKTTQLLANVLAKTAAREEGAYEAWLVDDEGFVTEGTSTNAWIVTASGEIVTRNLSHAILPGVTRQVILAAAAEAQLTVKERKFTLQEAHTAKEAFISSATGAAIPVVNIDANIIGDGKPGALTRRIFELYAAKSGIAKAPGSAL